MAIKTITIPGIGSRKYDDTKATPKFESDGVVQVNRTPVNPTDVVRLSDSGGVFAPAASSYIVIALDGTLTAERRLQGTVKQVILTDGGANGDLTLSTPQSIDIDSNVQFNNLEIDGALNHDGSTAGLFGVTPVSQQTHIVDADGNLADITTKFNDLLSKLEALGLLATS